MNEEEIKEYINRKDELLLKLSDKDKDTLEWILFGYNECARLLNEKEKENQQLKKQLEYIRSGEYYNQLRFERDMLQNIVDSGEVSKEDKEFIDMTHRNTELLEENEQLKRELNALKVSEEEWLERNDK